MTSLSKRERRTRILLALDDGEFGVSTIAAWTELSRQAVSADLAWLKRESFAGCEAQDDELRWHITNNGRAYLAGLSDAEKTW